MAESSAVNGPIEHGGAIGAVALGDAPWAEEAPARLAVHEAAPDLFEHLARAAILTRRFSGEPTWLRFGIPGGVAQFERLETALAEWAAQPVGRRRVGLRSPCA